MVVTNIRCTITFFTTSSHFASFSALCTMRVHLFTSSWLISMLFFFVLVYNSAVLSVFSLLKFIYFLLVPNLFFLFVPSNSSSWFLFIFSSLLLTSRLRSSVPVPLYPPTDSLSFTFVFCIFCSHLSFLYLPHTYVNAFSSLYRSVIWLTTPAVTWSTVSHCKRTDCYNRIIGGLSQTAT